jgi:hypothetical protein
VRDTDDAMNRSIGAPVLGRDPGKPKRLDIARHERVAADHANA